MMTVFPITLLVKDYCIRGEVYFASVYKDIRRIPALDKDHQTTENEWKKEKGISEPYVYR